MLQVIEEREKKESNDQTLMADSQPTTQNISQPKSRTTSIGSKRRKKKSSDKCLKVIPKSLRSDVVTVQQEHVGRYSSYGKHIAQELEELSPNMAIYCKKIINEAIYQAELRNLTSESRVVNEEEDTFSEY